MVPVTCPSMDLCNTDKTRPYPGFASIQRRRLEGTSKRNPGRWGLVWTGRFFFFALAMIGTVCDTEASVRT